MTMLVWNLQHMDMSFEPKPHAAEFWPNFYHEKRGGNWRTCLAPHLLCVLNTFLCLAQLWGIAWDFGLKYWHKVSQPIGGTKIDKSIFGASFDSIGCKFTLQF